MTQETVSADDAQASTPARSGGRRALLVTVLRWVLLVAVITFAIYQVAHQWRDFSAALHAVSWISLVASLLCVILGQLAGTKSWQILLNDLGPHMPLRRAGPVFLVGQLGKYVPGSVWAYVLQMELGKRHGLSRARVLSAGLFAAGIAVVSSLVLGLLAIPVLLHDHRDLLWLYVLLPVGLACLHPKVMSAIARLVFRLLRRPPLDRDLRLRAVAGAGGWAVLSYVFLGLHLWLLLNALVDPGGKDLLICIGGLAVAMTAGLFAVLLPSGVGVREAVIVAVLVTVVSHPQAFALALLSRVLFLFTDLLMAGGASLLALGGRSPRAAPVPKL